MKECKFKLTAKKLEKDKPNIRMCKCGNNEASPSLHYCPYQYEINDDDSENCDCCDDCMHECAMDV